MTSDGRVPSELPPYPEPPPPYSVKPITGARPRTEPPEAPGGGDPRELGEPRDPRASLSETLRYRRRSESPPGTRRATREADQATREADQATRDPGGRRRSGGEASSRRQRRERRQRRDGRSAPVRSRSAGRASDSCRLEPHLFVECSCPPRSEVAAAEAGPRAAQDAPDGVVWSSAKTGPVVSLPRVPPSELEERFRKTKAFKYGRRKLVLRGGIR